MHRDSYGLSATTIIAGDMPTLRETACRLRQVRKGSSRGDPDQSMPNVLRQRMSSLRSVAESETAQRRLSLTIAILRLRDMHATLEIVSTIPGPVAIMLQPPNNDSGRDPELLCEVLNINISREAG